MSATEFRYWPFEVPPADDRSNQESQQVEFLETASVLGFPAYQFGVNDFGARHQHREGCILERGRSRWEVRLAEDGKQILAAYIDDFASGSAAVLDWLRGSCAQDILAHLSEHLTELPGAKTTYLLAEYLHTS